MTAQSEIRKRREALGMSKSALAREANINRDTLGDLEAGKGFQAATLDKLTKALDRLEAEAGVGVPGLRPIGDPGERLISFEVPMAEGATFVVRGPIEDAELLREQAIALYESTRNGGQAARRAGANS